MNKRIIFAAIMFAAVAGYANPTAPYMDTQVQINLQTQVGEKVDSVHFVRDNNDPKVITKAYVLENADPYALRSYLRQMVQTKRVDTNATAVECLKFEDGPGLLFVSAEDYRFDDQPSGMGIDSIVAMLDRKDMRRSSGQPKFVYFPKNVPAEVLLPMVRSVGMNVFGDNSEVAGGTDYVAVDGDLNCLFFNSANYSRKNIEQMLKAYDQPIPEIRIKISVYEIYAENDDKIGNDFQAWKNGGVAVFSAGGRFRNNWDIPAVGRQKSARGFTETGVEKTSYYNFNPRWNTRYLDFLVSKSKAKITHTGELTVRQGQTADNPAMFRRSTQVFYEDKSIKDERDAADGTNLYPVYGHYNTGSGGYIPITMVPVPDGIPADAALNSMYGKKLYPFNTQLVIQRDNRDFFKVDDNSYGLEIQVSTRSITPKAAVLGIYATNTSLIGYRQDGKPRIQGGGEIGSSWSNSSGYYVEPMEVMISAEKNEFILGGLEKFEVVESETGLPILKDIPFLGYFFKTKSVSTKRAQLAVVAECEYIYPESEGRASYHDGIQKIENVTKKASELSTTFSRY